MKNTGNRGVDRISELPEPILHHILSYLPFKQIAQISVLSKKWEDVWRTYPDFTIDKTVFRRNYLSRTQKQRRMKLYECLEGALQKRLYKDGMSIEKFKIVMSLLDDPEFEAFVDRCVCYAIGSNVKKLELKIDDKYLGVSRYYDLPSTVLFAKSIEVLELEGCKLELPRRRNVTLSSLRKLDMYEVYLDDHVMKNLLDGCPLIEELIVDKCLGFETVELFGHDRVDDIKIDVFDIKRVDIKALNVNSLSLIVEYLSISPLEINLAYCTNLKNIRLEGTALKDEWLFNLIAELKLLEHLSLCYCDKVNKIQISSASLQTLEISYCSEVVELKIYSPNLSHFTYRGDMIKLRLNALALSNVELFLDWEKVDSQLCVNFVELLAQFHNFSGMLRLWVNNKVFVPSKELRQMLPSPLSSGEHLKLRINEISSSFSIAKVVEDLLWIAPRTERLSIESDCFHGGQCKTFFKASFKFKSSYKKPLGLEGRFASCWQLCMEKVELEITNIGEDVKTKGSHSLEGAKFLEQIDGLCELHV